MEKITFTLQEAKLELAKAANHQAWDLLEKSDRDPTDGENLLLAAYTSLYHWREIGTAVNDQRGCWMAAKAHLSLGQPAQALYWARKCRQITEAFPQDMEDFDLAYAQEVLARAYALAGEIDRAGRHRVEAAALGKAIKDPEDRRIFLQDLKDGEWFDLPRE